MTTSTPNESFAIQGSAQRLNRWQAIWLLMLIQLMAVLAVVSSQPVDFAWLSWRDLPGMLLLAMAIILQLTTSSFETHCPPRASRLVKVLFVVPLITWFGLWGHQSVVAQLIEGLLLISLGVSTGVPPSHVLSINRFLNTILDSVKSFMESGIGLRQTSVSDHPAHSCDPPCNEPCDEWQQTWRRQRDAAGDRISGRATFEFPAGQRTAWYHLPIWPLMTQSPSVQLGEPLGQVTGKVRATQVETYGVRLELKLDRASANDEQIYVDFWLEAKGEASS
jgi:uncharacterized integral membrane protein